MLRRRRLSLMAKVRCCCIIVFYLLSHLDVPLSFKMNEPEHKVHFTSPVEIVKGTDGIRINVEYTGTLNDKMRGFYRSSYKDNDGNVKYMASTQFEVCFIFNLLFLHFRVRTLVVHSRVSMSRITRQHLMLHWK
jgi:hypothetical protein